MKINNILVSKSNIYIKILENESEKDKIKVESSFVEYASEDYFIAYKIAKTLNIDSLIENNNLKNKIRVITK